ncbi:MAG: tRNA 2-thiouridine(34) synthase MnmA [Sedimentisphaerales bacterium]|nr:tRNA 2-thiouridine(34) synthase MnmA [Sedimentisphaerales bacterium]
MTTKDKKVFVALSGGVDSSVTAALLCEQGYDCSGLFMITSEDSETSQISAQGIAKKLGLKLYTLDLRTEFEQILDYLCDEYRHGRTPNPCVLCNKKIKFGRLWSFANSKGADFLATGHYARILKYDGRFGLYAAADSSKDQSYALAMIDRDILPYVLLPMGQYSKKDVRKMAYRIGLQDIISEDSQEICFLGGKDYTSVLERKYPEYTHRGNVIDSRGVVLGQHNGIYNFTIGQRRGLGIAMGEPYYVSEIEPDTNTVTLGPKEEVMHKRFIAKDINWLGTEPNEPFQATVKIRYNDNGSAAIVYPQGSSVEVEFDAPTLAITPGQLAVFYIRQGINNRVIAGAWIDKVI